MKIKVQTIFNPPLTVYDTAGPVRDSGGAKAAKAFLKPVVQVVTDDGGIVYKSGDFYQPVGFYIAGGIVGLLLLWAGYKLLK